jgi:hypothetical protein
VQHEGEPLGGVQRLQHHQQGEPDGVGDQRLVRRVERVLGADDGIGDVRVERFLVA